MANTKINAFQVLEQLRKGITASAIAKQQGVSRQAINMWRQKFIEQGLLDTPKRGRPKSVINDTTEVSGIVEKHLEKMKVELLQRISVVEAENVELTTRLRLLEKQIAMQDELDKRQRELRSKQEGIQLKMSGQQEASLA